MKENLPNNIKHGTISWMAGNSVAANLIMIFCLVGGTMAMFSVKKEVFPEFTADSVTVSVAYPGASPEEVEKGVILPIEEAVQGVENVDEVISTAYENRGIVIVEAVSGADLTKLVDDVQSEIDNITTFPDEIEEPAVKATTRSREVLSVMLYGDIDPRVLQRIGENVKDHMIQNPDITKVELTGLPGLEIRISVSQENLRRYGLTLGDIANRIRQRSVDLPGGDIDTSGGEVLVRVTERRDYGEQFRRMPILTTPDGSEVLLGDLAEIHDGFEETDRYVLFEGKPTVEIEVYRIGNQTPIEVSDAVIREMKDMAAFFPEAVQYKIYRNRSDYYRQRSELMLKNGAMGLVLVLILMGVFLEIRLAFWVMMGIPISFLGSFLLLPFFDVSINMITMFAYIIALGIVVDDAIVVGENIYSYRQKGNAFLTAAVLGTREVAVPVTFSVLTNIAAFLPLMLVPGMTGKIFGIIPVVVTAAFVISLFECLYVLPAHLGHGREQKKRSRSLYARIYRFQQSFSSGFIRMVRTRYGPFLDRVLLNKYLAVALAAGILVVVLAYVGSGRMGMTLFPDTDSDFSRAEVVFPYGTPVAKTRAAAEKLIDAARKVVAKTGRPELCEGKVISIGRGGSHVAHVYVLLADPEIRERIMNTKEFTNAWRSAVPEIPGIEYMKFSSSFGGPGGRGDAINVELRHRDINVLRSASLELAEELHQYPIVDEINDGFQPGKPQFDIRIKPSGEALGLTAAMVGRQIRDAFYGARAIRQLRGRNEVDIMVKLPESERSSEFYLEDFMVRAPSGTFIPLREAAVFRRGRSYLSIDRRNGRRVVQVTGDATPKSRAGEVLTDLRKTALPDLIRKYPGLGYSFEGRRAEINESMGSLKTSFAIAMIVIFAMLAIPLRSYAQPLIIMMSVPFGIVGAILGHLIMGYSMSVISMFGVVALSGVVVNDSLILITFANNARENLNMSPVEAIREAALQRFRPILLTSLTTFGGLAPLIFESSFQARIMIPMAISLGFGILFALFITLGIVPAFYLIVEECKNGFVRFAEFLRGP